ncbi:MAG: hypothetical protein EOO36_10285, partial [Cytophagaceae bacterium]
MKHLFFSQQKRVTSATPLSRQARRLEKRRLAKAVKLLPVLLGMLAAAPAAQAQTPSWQAAESLNQGALGGTVYGQKTVVDASGNTLVTGYYNGKVVIGGTTLVSAGGSDIFVGKLDASGNWLWVKSAGGTSADYGNSVALDASGNVLLTGNCYTTAQFGSLSVSITSGVHTFVAKLDTNGVHTFVAKLDTNGNWLWVKASTGSGIDVGMAVATDASGNVVVTGYTGGTSSYGSTAITASGNYYDGFVAKLDGSGNWLWAKGFGGSSSDQGSGIATDASGNIFMTGLITGAVSFGGTNLTGAGGYDIVVAKLNASGAWQWAKQAGGSGYDQGNGIALDASGNVFAIGTYSGTGSFGGTSLTSAGNDDLAVLKLSNSGTWLWAKSAGGANRDQGNSIAVDATGNALIAGTFNNSINFGSTSLLSADYSDNLAVASLSSSGAWNWAKNSAGTGSGIAADASGNAVVTGTVSGATTLGSTTLVSNDTNPTLLVAKTSATSWLWAAQANNGASTTITATTADASGNMLVAGTFTGITNFGTSTLTSSGSTDGFVGKRDAGGNWLWVKKVGGVNRDAVASLVLDNSGNVLLTGTFTGTATVGGTTLTSPAQYGSQLFAAKLDASGTVLWAKAATGSNAYMTATSLTADGSGNVLLTGSFYGTASFGSTSLTSTGQYDAQPFVAKLDASGSWLWAKTAPSTADAVANGIQVDSNGNAFLTGSFLDQVTFGSTTLASSAQYTYSTFIAKMDAAGNWLWAKGPTSTASGEGSSLAVDGSGNVVVTGYFSGTATFGSTSLTSAGTYNYSIFLTKLDGSGNWLWAKASAGTSSQQSTDLVLDGGGNAVLTGYFDGTATFGNTSLTSAGGADVVVAKADATGNWLWAKQAGGDGYDQAMTLALDASGNVVVGGSFQASNSYGPNASASFGALTIAGPPSGNTGFVAALVSPLAIVSFTPDNGPAGTSVVLTGRGFTSVSSVSFNGTAAPGFVVNSATQITVNVPAGATTGPVSVVTSAGTATSTTPFTVPADLVVSTPQAIGGTYRNVTVTGSGAATLTSNLAVTGTLTVQSGGQLNTKTYIVSGGGFVLADGATLSIGSAAGIAATGSTGSIQTTARTFSAAAS